MNIETKRLIIRPPQLEDVYGAFEFKKDVEATKFVGGITDLDFQEFNIKFIDFCKSYKLNEPYEFSVILKKTNSYIGYCGIKYCEIVGDFEILYGLNSEYWKKGYALEAGKEILKYAFDKLKLNRVIGAVNSKNPASEKILKTLGLKYKKKIEWPDQGLVNMYELTTPC